MDKNESLMFLDKIANEMGKSELLEALARSMDSDYLKSRLEFIARCYDLNLNKKGSVNMKNDKILENVTRYADIEEYGKYNAGATMEDLKEYMSDGSIRELTPGTYNGALDKFDRVSKLTDRDIIDQIKAEMLEDDFIQETLEELYPELKTDDEKALEFTYIYNVFTIGERLYIDVD